MKRDVITIGDALITFNPSSQGPMRYVNSFERKVGGAELNFAIGCARLGLSTGWISRLGNDEFGRYIYNFVRGEGIDVSQVKLVDGYPTSLNFKEILPDGEGRTFYYRDKSPTLTLSPESLLDNYFQESKILHISGVFPAIDDKNINIIERAIELAKKYNLLISFDPNIRLRLWSKERAKEVLTKFLKDVDIFLTGEKEAELLLDTNNPQEVFARCKDLGISYVAIKRGEFGSIGYHQGRTIEAPAIPVKKVVDTVGAGDGFDAGFIYGILQKWPLNRIINFSNLIGSMVVGVSGDNEGLPYLDEVLVRLGEKEHISR